MAAQARAREEVRRLMECIVTFFDLGLGEEDALLLVERMMSLGVEEEEEEEELISRLEATRG